MILKSFVIKNTGLKAFFPVLIFLFSSASCDEMVRATIFDTEAKDAVVIAPTMLIAKKAGLNCDYVGVDRILNLEVEELVKNTGDIVFFVINIDLVRSLVQSPGFLSKKYLNLINSIVQEQGKTVCLMLPEVGLNVDKRLALLSSVLEPVFNDGFEASELEKIKVFLKNPMKSRGLSYHTSLLVPSAKLLRESKKDKGFDCSYFDFNKRVSVSKKLDFLKPLAALIKGKKRDIVISSNNIFYLICPEEDFKYFPMASGLQTDLVRVLIDFFSQARKLCKGKKQKPKQKNAVKKTTIRSIYEELGFCFSGRQKCRMFDKHVEFKNVGWIEIDEFLDGGNNQICQKMFNQIIDAGLDWIWINLSPNMLYNVDGVRKQKKDQYLKAFEYFSEGLINLAEAKKKPTPKLLMGFEIGNNLVGDNLPKNPAYDIFGNCYDDLPEPLDCDFWESQFIKPLEAFLADHAGKSCLPVEGVVIDLEMYLRKFINTFSGNMGFGKKTISGFFNDESYAGSGCKFSIDDLQKNLQLEAYYKYLLKASKALGKRLFDKLNCLLPDKQVCCYAPNLTFNWFYSGFYAGLSCVRPIQIFSLTHRFDLISKMVAQKGINCSHSGVAMLSKVIQEQDFKFIDGVVENNKHSAFKAFDHDGMAIGQRGGVWTNRFSRLSTPFQSGAWYFLEQTVATDKTRERLCEYLSGL